MTAVRKYLFFCMGCLIGMATQAEEVDLHLVLQLPDPYQNDFQIDYPKSGWQFVTRKVEVGDVHLKEFIPIKGGPLWAFVGQVESNIQKDIAIEVPLRIGLNPHLSETFRQRIEKLVAITDGNRTQKARNQDFELGETLLNSQPENASESIVRDKQTGLIWQRFGTTSAVTWEEAVKLQKRGWRLPLRYELETLIHCPTGRSHGRAPEGKWYELRACTSPSRHSRISKNAAIVPAVFADTLHSEELDYWTQSIVPYAGKDYRYTVSFKVGKTSPSPIETTRAKVRLVRNPDFDKVIQRELKTFDVDSIRKWMKENKVKYQGQYYEILYTKVIRIADNMCHTPIYDYHCIENDEWLTLPPSIVAFHYLEKLELPRSRLERFPSNIGELSFLKTLDLRESKLTELPENTDKLQQLTTLMLRNNKFKKFPNGLLKLKKLKSLNLSSNGITELPESISKLRQLKALDLSYNEIAELPESIGELIQLKVLMLQHNDIATLPQSLNRLTQLESLELSFNKLSAINLSAFKNLLTLNMSVYGGHSFPKGIEHLAQLRELSIVGSGITQVPNELVKLTQLEILDLSMNKIKEFPEEIGQLKNLKELDLFKNNLAYLPSEIINLDKLEKLIVGSNQLRELPKGIGKLSKLKELHIGGNQLTTLPAELMQLKKLTSFRYYYNENLVISPEMQSFIDEVNKRGELQKIKDEKENRERNMRKKRNRF